MARMYIKDLLKSMLKMESPEDEGKTSTSQGSLSSQNSDSDEEETMAENRPMGLRSPNGPLRGRSVKEFEEQLSTLRKENFNLKLRIYFLEERMGTNFNLDKDNAVKQNIELLVEVESLRKEIQEKQELLCQAVKAMELEEEEHKKDSDTKGLQILDLQKELEVFKVKCESFQDSRQQLDQGEIYFQAFDIPDKNADLVKDLQMRVEELEHELQKEKETNSDLTKHLKLSENKQKISDSLETELQQKDEKLKFLISELENKSKVISSYSSRLKSLQEQLEERTNELQAKSAEFKRKESESKTKFAELEELRKLLNETKNINEADQRKIEKHRASLTQRQNRITELETLTEKQRSRIMYLETMLEQAQSDVKKKTDELQVMKSPARRQKSTITDVDSFLVSSASPHSEGIRKKTSVNSPLKSPSNSNTSALNSPSGKIRAKGSLGEEDGALVLYQKNTESERSVEHLEVSLDKSKKHILKLEKDQVRACKIIQSMLETRKEHMKQISDLEFQLATKNKEVDELQTKITKEDGGNRSIQSKISELNLTASTNPPGDSENASPENLQETKQLLEQYKELTMELDKQKQILITTLKEKDNQMQKLQEQYHTLLSEMKIKEEQIVDLQFEIVAHSQESRDTSLTEKKDVGSEKGSWVHEMEEKNKKIEQLESELRKRNCDLQGLVNNELWEKNREIEKLQNRYGSASEVKDGEICKLRTEVAGLRTEASNLRSEAAVLRNEASILRNESSQLRSEISSKDFQLQMLKDKISELGVHLSSNIINTSVKRESSASDDLKSLQEQIMTCIDDRKLRKTPEKDQIQQLKRECQDLQDELEKSEQLRQETQDICAVLSTRLEELAYFLDSLLKQKTVLGFLGSRKNSRLRQFVDQTLDLSRTLSLSMTLNPDQSLLQLSNISSLLNASRKEHLEVSEMVPEEDEKSSLSLIPGEMTLTYQSHLNRSSSNVVAFGSGKFETVPPMEGKSSEDYKPVTQESQIIQVLREQIENLKKEIEIRDIELGKKLQNDQELVDAIMDLTTGKPQVNPVLSPQKIYMTLLEEKGKGQTSTTLKYKTDNHSESESWSEPDRNVSLARIGLNAAGIRPQSGGVISRHRSVNTSTTESTEEETNNSNTKLSKKHQLVESRQLIANLTKQVADLESLLKEKESQLLSTEVAFYESDNALKREHKRFEEVKKQTEELQNLIRELETRLESYEEAKVCTQSHIEALEKTVEELEVTKQNLMVAMDTKDKDLQNKLNRLEQEKNEALKAARSSEDKLNNMETLAAEMVEATKKEIKVAEDKLEKLMQENEKIREEERTKYNSRMEALETECETKIKAMKAKAEEQIKKLSEAATLLQDKYEAEYVKRTEVDKLKNTIQELENVRQRFLLTEEKMREMEFHENELTKRLQELERDHRDKVNSLRKELDHATLQYSEAMLEKTKLINEKATLEKQIKEFGIKERDFTKQVNEFQKDFASMKESFQKRVSHLEQQKSNLEIKISELEVQNAELRTKLIKVHVGQSGEGMYAGPTPNSSRLMEALVQRSNGNVMYNRQESDKSGYTSEDVAEEAVNNSRRNANSSPDLGIEGDHGRSSLEVHHLHLPRPMLQTLELTESMSNLLEDEQHRLLLCNNEQCTEKTRQIVNENMELKKRLSRTRHALEETVTQLSLANQRKKQVEKTICKQIHKTSQVLRKAKANLDSGSESDIIKR